LRYESARIWRDKILDKRFLNITVEIGIRSIVGCMPEEWWQKI
jgi:hypothetical protein